MTKRSGPGASYVALRRAQLVARGCCYQCGKPHLASGALCPSCRQRSRDNAARRRQIALEAGLCPVCCKRRTLDGYASCYRCRKNDKDRRSRKATSATANRAVGAPKA